MKGIDIFCASQASTAICLSMSMDQASSSTTIQLGGKAIDRNNPIIRDSRRAPSSSRTLAAPCSSKPPISPKPHQKSKKNPSSSKQSEDNKRNSKRSHDQKKKNSDAEMLTEHISNNNNSKPSHSDLRRRFIKPPADLITPPTSSRYLLGDTASLDGFSDYEPVLAITPVDNKKAQIESVHQNDTNPASKLSSSCCPKSASSDQVVVLRVSLHCKGCEGKVRKHLSRMEGVSSFDIDFKAKKVTVVGDVTPLAVLASVSKVKNAQIWPASASAVGNGIAGTKK